MSSVVKSSLGVYDYEVSPVEVWPRNSHVQLSWERSDELHASASQLLANRLPDQLATEMRRVEASIID